MGTPDSFKSKRMDKEKWKRIIQPDRDSDSSLENWDDSMNGNGNGNENLSSIRVTHVFENNRQLLRTPVSSDEPQDGQASVPNTTAATVTSEPCAGSSSSPDVLPMQIGIQHSRILNHSASADKSLLRIPHSALAITPTINSNSQQNSSSTTSPSLGSPPSLGSIFGRLTAGRPRRVHFHEPISFEGRLQRVKDRLHQRNQFLRNEPYRHPKDPRTARTPTSPVLSSSIASLRSMMRCGNNPDWLKLSGQNVPHRPPAAWIGLGAPMRSRAGSSSDYTNENWGVEDPQQTAEENVNITAPTNIATSDNNTASSVTASPVHNAFNVTVEADDTPATGAGDAMSRDTTPEVETNIAPAYSDPPAQNILRPAAHSSTSDVVQVQTVNPISEVSLNSGILSMLECPVCLDHMGPPIHQCKRGHLICNNCRAQLLNCPTCRTRFIDFRNLAMERIAELIHFPCKNEKCDQSFKLGNKDQHELNCLWRMYHCTFPGCNWRGLHKNLLAHSQESHSDSILTGVKHFLEMPLDKIFTCIFVLSAWGELFKFSMQRGPGVNIINAMVQYVGPVARAAEFKFTLSLEQKLNVSRHITYCRTMHSDNVRPNQVYSSGDAFCVSGELAKHFSNDAKTACLLVELEKV